MDRSIQHVIGRARLDDAARVHDADPIREPGHDRQIVGDPDQRGSGLAAKLLYLVENLTLDGHIQRGGRPVGDDQCRPLPPA